MKNYSSMSDKIIYKIAKRLGADALRARESLRDYCRKYIAENFGSAAQVVPGSKNEGFRVCMSLPQSFPG
jgi:hypothetical protein